MRKIIMGAVIGGLLGYLYYKFVGCASGTCPITSNPIISTIYGTAMGGLTGSLLVSGKGARDKPAGRDSDETKAGEERPV